MAVKLATGGKGDNTGSNGRGWGEGKTHSDGGRGDAWGWASCCILVRRKKMQFCFFSALGRLKHIFLFTDMTFKWT